MEKRENSHVPAKPMLRIKAFIADIIVLFVPAILINNYLVQAGLDKTTLTFYSGLFNLVCFSYFVYFTYKRQGATPGKKFMKIQVVSEAGKLTFYQIVLRYGILFLLFSSIPFLLSVAGQKQISNILGTIFVGVAATMLFFDKKHQSFHDKAAKTLVVKNTP